MNFLKKVIGLSMAAITAFGGFAADAIKFRNIGTRKFIYINYSSDKNCYIIHSKYQYTEKKSGYMFIRSYQTTVDLKDILDVKSDNEIDDNMIDDYIEQDENLTGLLNCNEYKAPGELYWKIYSKDYLKHNFKKEAIIFNYYMHLTDREDIEKREGELLLDL